MWRDAPNSQAPLPVPRPNSSNASADAVIEQKIAALHARVEGHRSDEKSAPKHAIFNYAKASTSAAILLAPAALGAGGWMLGVFVYAFFGVTAARLHARPTGALLTSLPAQACVLASHFCTAFWCIRTAFYALLEGLEYAHLPASPGALVVLVLVTLTPLVALNTNFHQYYKTSFFGLVLLGVAFVLLLAEKTLSNEQPSSKHSSPSSAYHVQGLPQCIAYAALSFSVAPVVPLIEQSLSQYKDLPRVVAAASVITTLAPVTLALAVFGSAPQDWVTQTLYAYAPVLPASSGACATRTCEFTRATVLLSLAASLFAAYPLIVAPCHYVLEAWLLPVGKKDVSHDGTNTEAATCAMRYAGLREFLTCALRVGVLLGTLFASLFTRSVGELFVLASGALALVTSFFIPSVYRLVDGWGCGGGGGGAEASAGGNSNQYYRDRGGVLDEYDDEQNVPLIKILHVLNVLVSAAAIGAVVYACATYGQSELAE